MPYLQTIFVLIAFTLMVTVSYFFISDIERKHLQRDIKNAISYTEANIKADMLEPETILAGISETIRNMILTGVDAETVNRYIQNINNYVQNNESKRLSGVHGFYGVFDVYGGIFLTGDVNWKPSYDYDMQNRPFYIAAVEANGDIGVTPPYFNIAIGRETITFVRRIFNEANQPLGIICLNIFINRVKQHAINTQFAENGYGFLLNQNMELIAHPEPSMLGMRLRNVKSYIAAYEDELSQNGYIHEITTTDYRGIKSIVFIQRLYNGWYMGVVTPRDEYYHSTRNMALFLIALGIVLAVILIIILGRISVEKDKAEERMRIMFDSMPLGANIHDESFDFFECNDYMVNMFGLSSKKELREKFFDLWPEYQPDGQLSRKKIAQFDEKVFTDGYCRFEWTYQNLKGELIPGECTLVRVRYKNEFVVAAYIRDLREIKEADERVQLMFDATPMGANFWSKDYRVIDCNLETVRLFDMPNKQVYLDRFFDLSPEYQPDGKASFKKGIEFVKKAFEEGYNRFEWVHQKLSGELIPCEVTLIRVKYKDGYIVIGYTRDLREQKAMLAEIHRENEKSRAMAHWYNSILNSIPLPISVTDADAKWTFINTAVERIIGIKLEDAVGKPCSNWGSVVCNTQDCGIACVKRGITQTYFSTGDISLQVDTAILKDLSGNTIGYIEIAQDITNLKILAKKQADAEAASRAKSAFLARISHEIRTPMNAILGITEIQLQDEYLQPHIKEAFNEIYNSGDLLISIINDILDLSKIEADKMELNVAKYETASLINDIVHINMMRSSKFVEFELKVDENISSKFLGDELRIKQILNNILSNAYKYTEEGVIKLSVYVETAPEEEHDTIVFCVSDTGQGMTEEQINTVFTTEYSRFNPKINRTVEGTGLGMNITWRLVRMMNGMISVESQPGKGTKFTVRLPQKRASSEVLGKEIVEKLQNFRISSSSQMKKAKITREYMPYGRVLIVDDVYSNLYVAKGLMVPYGLAIDLATSGFEAIDKIKAGELYDVIFMDHMMPKMDGLETTKIIRDLGYKNSIVALTANAITGQAKFFLENGFDEFISKPIDIRQLNAILNKLIRDKQTPEVIAAAHKQKQSEQESSLKSDLKPNSVLQTVFLLDVKQSLPILEDTLERIDIATEDDLRLFTISVHAMKSALANIGEAATSKQALALELAGKEQNRSFIKTHAKPLIDSIRRIEARMLLENDNATPSGDVDESIDFLREQLQIISKACAAYDERPINAALEALNKLSWKKETKTLIDKIAEQILYGDFDEAGKLAKEQ